MNKLLQNEVYNISENWVHGYFKENDYVMRTKNKYSDDIIRVNGDTGQIRFINKQKQVTHSNTGITRVINTRIAQIIYDDDSNNIEEVDLIDIADNFTLNYCNTVHKYQGSQKDVVVFIASSLHCSLSSWGTNRLKLAYTAISRAVKNLIIIGDENTFFNIQDSDDEQFVSSFMIEFNEYNF